MRPQSANEMARGCAAALAYFSLDLIERNTRQYRDGHLSAATAVFLFDPAKRASGGHNATARKAKWSPAASMWARRRE